MICRLASGSALAAFLLVVAPAVQRPTAQVRDQIPERLTDQEFWQLSSDLSEPSGLFGSDNLLSNERDFAKIAAELRTRVAPGGVYVGVGPEQNFTYMAAIRPRMAFVIDIRRGNLQLQLLYKALFELSADRADFVSRLFTKKRPDGLGPASTAADLVNAYWAAYSSGEAAFRGNLADVFETLTVRHGLLLSEEDRAGIEHIYYALYWNGPRITWSVKAWPPTTPQESIIGLPTWADLMAQADDSGVTRSFLATEEQYRVVKELETRNLIVPVVGDFAGPKAIRAVGDYVRQRGAIVNVFYASNVEDILQNNGRRSVFCANAVTLPLDETSLLIRMGRLLPVSGFSAGLTSIHFGPGSSRSITINGVALPPDQVKAYFDQPTAALIDLPAEVKRCSIGR